MSASTPVREPGVQSRSLEDEWLLYDPGRSALHVINETAHFVWNLCDGRHSKQDICRQLIASYGARDPADVRKDVEEILRSFVEAGVVR